MLHSLHAFAREGDFKVKSRETKKNTTALKTQIILLSLLIICTAALFCLPTKSTYADEIGIDEDTFSYNDSVSLLADENAGSSGNVANSNTAAAVIGGWKHNSNGWRYVCSTGAYAKGFQEIDDTTYYFDSKGWMKTGWQKISNKWYYFNKSGAMAKGWKKVGKSWYYLDSDGVMQTGKKTISGKTYYLKSNGAMKTGWNKENNKWFYYNSSGDMAKGWKKVGKTWYYLGSDGVMQTGKRTISGKTYYLKSNGAMKTGWQKISNKWYYFNKSGAMQMNKWISGKYWVGSDGVMATSSWVDGEKYYVDKNGKWVQRTRLTGTFTVEGLYGYQYLKNKASFSVDRDMLTVSGTLWGQNSNYDPLSLGRGVRHFTLTSQTKYYFAGDYDYPMTKSQFIEDFAPDRFVCISMEVRDGYVVNLYEHS